MAWTTPRTWVAGEVLTSTLLNTHVRDNLNFLYSGRPAARATLPSAQTIPNATWTIIGLAGESWDYGNLHDVSTNNHELVLTAYPGRWIVVAYAEVVAGGGTIRGIRILNPSTGVEADRHQVPISGNFSEFSVTTIFDSSPYNPSYVYMQVYQDSGGALNLSQAAFSAVMVG